MPHSPIVSTCITASLWDDDSVQSLERINKYEIDIDENGEWEMPEGVTADEERCIRDVMEKYMETKWDANDYDIEEDREG